MGKKWYEDLLLIADFIPPNPDELDRFDVEAQVDRIMELGFNSQHIEVNDITIGEAGITFFKSEHAIQQRSDLLGRYRKRFGKHGGNDIIYFNVHWLNKDLMPLHPEWFQLFHSGELIPIGYGSGGYSCINSPFRDWAFNIISDIGKYGVKGIFLDGPVFNGNGCYCKGCMERFEKQYGFRYDPESIKDIEVFKKVLQFKHESIAEFVREARNALKSVNPEAVIYMNGLPLGPSTCGRDNRMAGKWQDALLAEGGFLSGDLRSLPIWKPAASAKILETEAEGKPAIVAIAGRHGPWARYLHTPSETWISYAMSVANGANVWYGIYDTNRDDEGMKTVTGINRFLSSNSNYLAGTSSAAKIGLVWSKKNANFYQTTTEHWDFVKERSKLDSKLKSDSRRAFNGWFEVLQRSHRLFDVIDDHSVENDDLGKYELLILPNVACMSVKEAGRLKEYVANGGNIITTYDTSCYDESGLPREDMLLGEVLGVAGFEGVEYMRSDHVKVEESEFTRGITKSLIPAPNLHLKALAADGAKVFMHFREVQPSVYCDLPAETRNPFITVNRFGKGRAVMIAGNVDATFENFRFPEYFTIMGNTVDMLSAGDVIVDENITSLFVNMRKKGPANIVHLINYTNYGGRPIASVIRLNGLKLSVRTAKRPALVKALKSGTVLPFTYDGVFVALEVPFVDEYEIIVLE